MGLTQTNIRLRREPISKDVFQKHAVDKVQRVIQRINQGTKASTVLEDMEDLTPTQAALAWAYILDNQGENKRFEAFLEAADNLPFNGHVRATFQDAKPAPNAQEAPEPTSMSEDEEDSTQERLRIIATEVPPRRKRRWYFLWLA